MGVRPDNNADYDVSLADLLLMPPTFYYAKYEVPADTWLPEKPYQIGDDCWLPEHQPPTPHWFHYWLSLADVDAS